MRILICLLITTVCSAAEQNQTQGLVVEAESLQPAAGSAWKVIRYGENYFWDAIGTAYVSGEKLLSAPEQCPASTASRTIRIPKAGRYKAWVHFECPKDFNLRFALVIEQQGREILNAPMGGADQIKLWPLGWGLRTQVNPAYGGGDNVCWQGADADLAAGDATLTLRTLENPSPAAKRNIDVIYLTTDASNKQRDTTDPFLDELDEPGRMSFRFINKGTKPLRMNVGVKWNRRNWRASEFAMQRSGLPEAQKKTVEPGHASDWIDIGSVLDSTHGSSVELSPAPGEDFGGGELVFRRTQDGAEWKYEWPVSQRPLHVWVPANLDPSAIITDSQIADRIWGYVKDLPAGPLPHHIKFYASFGPSTHEPRYARWRDLYYQFGYAGPPFSFGRQDPGWEQRFGNVPNRKGIGLTHQDPHPDFAKLRTELASPELKPVIARLEAFSIGDEIGINAFGDSNFRPKFIAHLQTQGFTPEKLGFQNWEQMRVPGREHATTQPVLYMEASEFGSQLAIDNMRKLTTTLREGFGRDVPIGANYAPHPIYLPDEAQWVDVFRDGALTMPWSEDYAWQVPIVSVQMVGWILDVMRCGAKYHNLPLMMYCMPHSPGNTTRDFRLSNYLALGRGVRYINHFGLGPQPFATENYVDFRDADRYREIYHIIREVGRVDALLGSAKPAKAEVAVMLCRYTDLWETSRGPDAYTLGGDNPNSNAFGIERQGLWLALKHLQVPVDLITDHDIAGGSLSEYKVLYLAGSHISRKTAEQITEWVRDGGILCSSAAGGLRDEYNRPFDSLLAVYGITSHEFQQRDNCVRPKMELPFIKSIDTAHITGPKAGFDLSALAIVDRVRVAAGAEILGTFKDGSPAVVKHVYGKGEALLINTMPGLAYLQSAIPPRPFDRNEFVHFLPTQFDLSIRALLAWPISRANVFARVECSEPLVEGQLLESPAGWLVALTNFSGKPVPSLRVTVRGAKPVQTIESVQQGTLEQRNPGGASEFRLSLDVADFIMARAEGLHPDHK